jgi:uncharacterized membrane protein YqaE (UPF0057 family)
MGCIDILLCIFLPPFASGVRGRGCGAMLFVLILTIIGWLPGAIAAFLLTIDYNDKRSRGLF